MKELKNPTPSKVSSSSSSQRQSKSKIAKRKRTESNKQQEQVQPIQTVSAPQQQAPIQSQPPKMVVTVSDDEESVISNISNGSTSSDESEPLPANVDDIGDILDFECDEDDLLHLIAATAAV